MNNYFIDHYDLILQMNFEEDVCFDDRDDEEGKRTCRFCGAIENEQNTFNKEAHAISNCLGNQTIMTENECDKCNSTFGHTLENELGNYISYLKPLLQIRGKRDSSIFIQEKAGKKISIRFDGEKNLEVITNNNDYVDFSPENKELKFKLKAKKYSPFKVYQAFMKNFLSILPKEYVNEADFVKLIINYDELDTHAIAINNEDITSNLSAINNEDITSNLSALKNHILSNAKAIKIFIPGYSLSDTFILKKKNESAQGPGFIWVIRIANFAYQFAIPTFKNSSSAEIPSIFDAFIERIPDKYQVKQNIEDFGYIDKIAPESSIGFSFSDVKKLTQEEINNLNQDDND